jgi:hypothetical protein
MTNPDNLLLDIEVITNQPGMLGRQKVHDERSRAFAGRQVVDRSTWRDKAVRIYDPSPNPNQEVGCCTAVTKAIQFNAIGNRRTGKVLGMDWALDLYSLNTRIDPFAGEWPPDDTGSSGLASAKAAQQKAEGGVYRWRFDGADGVVQEVMAGNVVSVGTRWDYSMFTPDAKNIVHPGGDQAGGHQWAVRGYDADRDLVMGRCWWGSFRDFWISRADLDDLLRDGGDAHVQARA